jgi:hypothetical protein
MDRSVLKGKGGHVLDPIVAPLALAFATGYGVGYGVREWKSRKRRRRHRHAYRNFAFELAKKNSSQRTESPERDLWRGNMDHSEYASQDDGPPV